MSIDIQPALLIEALCVSRGGRQVLDGLSLSVKPGEVYALLGGNGAGKSTTLLSCIGLLKPDSGRVEVMGHSAFEEIEKTRESIAYLAENARLYDHLSARENLGYFMALAGKAVDKLAMEQALDDVGLQKEARDRRTGNFSKGMRQKVAIALALLRGSPLLLLDEPTSGLDPLAVIDFHHLLLRIQQQGVAILMVTHDLLGACELATRVGLLRDGRLQAEYESSLTDDGQRQGLDLAQMRQAFSSGLNA